MQTAYEMPGLDGIEVAAALRNAVPGVRILMVTTFGRPGGTCAGPWSRARSVVKRHAGGSAG